ncbi:hypothetical protein [Dyella psychrodurans]|uniref:Flagellar protein FliT n=1 Tax=Dyella psychrodurans TaxID=1927960 RepID=A0A370X0I0_9GAMM|nr:hypothetical protein [Dyella psychrodurans]RDS81856.1 hypothetical protein DWU99_15650 [Dyella psychrodurans]
MNDPAHEGLERALEITAQMIEAARDENWSHVLELDARRQAYLQQVQAGAVGPRHRQALLALQVHNQTLLERAGLAHHAVEQQLGQHQYNHRALRTYIVSSSSR